MSGSVVEVEREGFVARVWLNRPEVRNAFNADLIPELAAAFTALGTDDDVRAIVLGGRGKAFCAGADLAWMREMADYSWEQNRADAARLADMLFAIYSCPRPVVGRIHGDCYAGGVGLAAVCDVLVAAERATFCLSEARLGLLPATISPYVIRAMGEQAARRYFVTAERFSAAQAKAMGFVHEAVRCRRRSTRSSTASSPRSSTTGRWRRAPARSWSRTSPACRSAASCAPTPPGASPTSAPASKAARACRASCRSASPPGWGRRAVNSLDLTQLAALAAALGWASGLRLYAVLFLTGLAGWLGWVDLPGGLRLLESPWMLGASGFMLFVEFFADKIPGLDTRLGRRPHAHPHPGRRGARRGRVRRRRGAVGDGGGPARRLARGHQPCRQGDDARGGEHLARAVLEHRPVAGGRRDRARRALARLGRPRHLHGAARCWRWW